MANLVEVMIATTGGPEAAAAFRGVGEAAAQMGVQADSAGVLTTKLGDAALVAGGALALGLGAAAVAAGEFDTSLVRVQNNTTMTAADVGTMRQAVLALSQSTGAGLGDLTTGFMRVDNITNDAAASMRILQVATESAVATGGNAATTANVLANAMHEYGLDTVKAADGTTNLAVVQENAARTMGVMHLAAAMGNMTLEEFSTASGKSIGIAANLGVSLEDVSAAFSALTRHGFDASQAGTQVTDMLTHLIKPSKEASDELERISKLTGIDLVGDFSAAGLSSKGLSGVLGDLKAAFEKMGLSEADATEEAMKLVGAQRGGLGMAALLGTANKDYTTTLATLTDTTKTAGITQESFARIQQTTGFEFATLKAHASALGIELGAVLVPQLNALVTHLQDGVQWFQSLSKETQTTIIHVAEGAAGFLLLGGAVIKTTEYMRSLVGVVETVIGAFARKEAAKKTLTAANEKLAASAGETAAKFGAVRAGATVVADTLAAGTVVTVAATAAWAGIIAGMVKYRDATGQTKVMQQEFTAQQSAAAFAVAHGATELNGATAGFARYIDATRTSVATQDQLVAAWNRYIGTLTISGQSTQGLTLATAALVTTQQAANRVLGEGLLAGNQYSTTIAGMAIATNALAATLPTMGAGLSGAAVAAGSLAVPAHTSALALQEINTYGTSAQQALNEFGGTVMASILQVQGLQTELGRANTEFALTQTKMQGVSGESSTLGGYLTTLQGEWNTLDAAVKAQGFTTDAQKAKYAELAPLIQYLNAKQGELHATTVGLTEQQVRNFEAIQNLNAAVAQGGATAAGATTALAAMTWATGSATSANNANTASTNATTSAIQTATAQAGTYTTVLNTVPKNVTTLVDTPGLSGAIGDVGSFLSALGRIPSNVSTTISTVYETVGSPPARARGGPVTAGLPYLVGEEGPEYFVPRQSGYILPHGTAAGSAGAASGGGAGGAGGGIVFMAGSIVVQGSVVTQGQLVDVVYQGLLQKKRSNPTLGLA